MTITVHFMRRLSYDDTPSDTVRPKTGMFADAVRPQADYVRS